MKFGVRDICDVVFKAKESMTIGTSTFVAGQPVLRIDTATASTLEQATTTVYAQGGKGNTRLVTWEGEKTLTFTVTDALLSPISLSILSGAGLFKGRTAADKVHVHTVANGVVSGKDIDLTNALGTNEKIDPTAPVFISVLDEDGDITGELLTGASVDDTGKKLTLAEDQNADKKKVNVDFYVVYAASKVDEIDIDASSFGGNFYVEASTLFRSRATGKDMPAEITLPNVKIQSNFTFSMAATGDPSTFDFTMDAMPGYTYFNHNNKVMCVIQIVEDSLGEDANEPFMLHGTSQDQLEDFEDSVAATNDETDDATDDNPVDGEGA